MKTVKKINVLNGQTTHGDVKNQINAAIDTINANFEEGGTGGANLTGYATVASEGQLPSNPSSIEKTLGYLIGTDLYVYVGKGGTTADGKYKNCGPFKGPKGDAGAALKFADLTAEEKKELKGEPGTPGKKGDKGDQGNTGSSVDYPFELVNNLTQGGVDKALSAEQGKVLSKQIQDTQYIIEDFSNYEIKHCFIGMNKHGEILDETCDCTGFIPARNGDNFVYTGYTLNKNICIAGYSANNNESFVKALLTSEGNKYKNFQMVITDPTIKYVRAISQNDKGNKLEFIRREYNLSQKLDISSGSERRQISQKKISEEIYRIDDAIKYIDGSIKKEIPNQALNNLDSLIKIDGWDVTGYIPVKNDDTILWGYGSKEQFRSCALIAYNKNKKPLKGGYYYAINGPERLIDFREFPDIAYIRASMYVIGNSEPFIKINGESIWVKPNYDTFTPKISKDVKSINRTLYVSANLDNNSFDKTLLSTGELADRMDYAVSDYIPYEEGLYWCFGSSSDLDNCTLQAYDKDKNIIKGDWLNAKFGPERLIDLGPYTGVAFFRASFFLKGDLKPYIRKTNGEYVLTFDDKGLIEEMRSFKKNCQGEEQMSPSLNFANMLPKYSLLGYAGIYHTELPSPDTLFDNNIMADELYAKYDALMTKYKDRISKEQIGISGGNNINLYAYTIHSRAPHPEFRDSGNGYTPISWDKIYKPTIIITSGVHGEEKGAVIALQDLVNDMFEKRCNETDFILRNCTLCIIPIVNPYGFNNNTRCTVSGKDVNNDYNDAGGFTLNESKAVRDFVSRQNNVCGFLDFHLCVSTPSVWADGSNQLAKNFTFEMHEDMIDNWGKLYPAILDHLPILTFYFNAWKGVASNYFYEKGIPSMTVESVYSERNLIIGNGYSYNTFCIKAAKEMYCNAIIHTVKAAASFKNIYDFTNFEIIKQSTEIKGKDGEIAEASIVAEGFCIQYLWQFSDDGGTVWSNDYKNRSQFLKVELRITIENRLYRCILTDSRGKSLTSENIKIVII